MWEGHRSMRHFLYNTEAKEMVGMKMLPLIWHVMWVRPQIPGEHYRWCHSEEVKLIEGNWQ